MVDLLTGLGAAAIVLSICDIGYKVVRKMIDLSQALRDLPSDLQSCKHLIEIILRTTQRFQQRLSPENGGTTVPSVATASVEDPQELLEHCANIANDLLDLLNGLQSSKKLIKAIKIIEKESKLLQTRNELNQIVTAILLILEGDHTSKSEEIRHLAIDLRTDTVVFRDDFYVQTFREIEAVEQRLLQDFHLLLSTRDQMARRTRRTGTGSSGRALPQLWPARADFLRQVPTAEHGRWKRCTGFRVRMIRTDQAAASTSQQSLSGEQVISQNLYSIKEDFARASDRDRFDGIGEIKIEIGYSSAFNYIRKVLWS